MKGEKDKINYGQSQWLLYLSDNTSSDGGAAIPQHKPPQLLEVFVEFQSHWSLCLQLYQCILALGEQPVRSEGKRRDRWIRNTDE